MASGEAQFNTNCWIRGRMVGMTGVFSGTFKTDEADIVSAVNIRNGSVSSYISYSFPAPGGVRANTKEIEWTIPAQEYGIVTDMTIPAVISRAGDPGPFGMWLYRNGVLIQSELLTNGAYQEDEYGATNYLRNVASFRIFDFDVPANESVTYRFVADTEKRWKGRVIETSPTSGIDTYHGINVWFSGKVIAAIRKR